ncbi:MAG: DUF4440 domain-containing protein [Sphingomicrobium sp.]
MIRSLLLALFLIAGPAYGRAVDAKAAVDDLIAADRAYSAEAAKAEDIVVGLAAMVDTDAVMPVPGKGHAVGKEAVIEALRANPSFQSGKVSWEPVRGGISADGTQGFTYGFLSLTAGDPARRERKYLAYWVKRPQGWRVVTYRTVVRQPGEASKDMLAPSLPSFSAEPAAEPAILTAQQASVAAAEKSFSDRAQVVGLKQAFGEFGRDDAMNMYSGSGFTIGLEAITAGFKDEGPAKIHWATERSFAASSGDLGVSIGTISPNDPKEGAGFPFFTIWRRDGPDQPWRYIAE